MANLKEIRTRISSVTSTRQITSAMKMVAAAKLKKAQEAVVHLRPYVHKMQDIMLHVSLSSDVDDDNVYAEDRDYEKVLIVAITSNRGLCGAFNSNIIKECMNLAQNKYGDLFARGKVRFMTIGKKGFDNLSRRNIPVDEQNYDIYENLTYENVVPIAQELIDSFVSGRYDCIDIVYNEFKNAATQKIISHQFLPLLPEEDHNHKQRSASNYIFEPSKQEMVKELIPMLLKLFLYQALLDSVASEYGARMTSMQQATDNATSLIQDLTLQYNKARQASITNEIVEIVGGAEALNG